MALKEELEIQGNWLFKYRSYLPIVILLIGLLVFIQANYHTKPANICNSYYATLCLFVSLTGLAIRIYTIGYTPKNTSGRNTGEGQVADELNTTGIYSMVRHPLYFGNFFMWLGIALLTENIWFIVSFVLFYWIYYERIMFAEEQFLERKFGEGYKKWADNVPAFIPKMGLFNKPTLSFSLKKVLKKEKNGLFAVFLIFTAFNIIGEWLKQHTHFNYFFLIGCIATMLIYVVLKILKMKTAYLNNDR